MSNNTLEKIIDNRIKEIEYKKRGIPIEQLEEYIIEFELMYNKKFYDFKKKIENNIKSNKISIIAEIKKASPSAGIIIQDYDPVKIANIYI